MGSFYFDIVGQNLGFVVMASSRQRAVKWVGKLSNTRFEWNGYSYENDQGNEIIPVDHFIIVHFDRYLKINY